jgi:hypothetical protein
MATPPSLPVCVARSPPSRTSRKQDKPSRPLVGIPERSARSSVFRRMRPLEGKPKAKPARKKYPSSFIGTRPKSMRRLRFRLRPPPPPPSVVSAHRIPPHRRAVNNCSDFRARPCRINVSAASFPISRNGDGIASKTRNLPSATRRASCLREERAAWKPEVGTCRLEHRPHRSQVTETVDGLAPSWVRAW